MPPLGSTMRVYCPECEHGFRVAGDEDDRKVRCPECGERFHVNESDDEYDDEPRRKPTAKPGKRPPEKADNSKTILVVVLATVGGLVVVGGVIAAVILLTLGNTDVAKTANPPPGATAPAPPTVDPFYQPAANRTPPPATRPTPNPTPPVGGPVSASTAPVPPRPNPNPPADPLDELFREPVDKSPLVTKVGVLARKPEEAPLTVPTFHSLMVANKLVKPSPQSKLTLEEVKAATVYIKVDAGELSGSGSGFYIGAENGAALVATNHHVIEAAAKKPEPGAEKAKITCVFHSGVPADERPTTARIVAFDPIADLAVLRLDNPPAKLPKPINPWATPKLTETMDVRICGFPFGEQLATATANPNISVNNGTVSSLRLNKSGGLDKVQISGAINPGNSGGPIVDKDGRLVGVAVSTIKGSGLGFAVPVDDLIGLLEGKILVTELVPVGLTDKAAKFKVRVLVMDPRGRVNKVYVRFWAGNGGAKPRAVKDAQYGHKPIENGLEFALKLPDSGSSLTGAEGDLLVPAEATSVVLQLGSEQVAGPGQPRGLLSISAPVEYTLSTKEVPIGSDSKPLGETFRDATALAGQTVVVRGTVIKPPSGSGRVSELTLADAAGRPPQKVKFLAAREVAVQFDEIDPEIHGNDVRVVCVVGQQGADGVVPVRVARCDFLDEGDVVVRSVPEKDTTDQLAAANRNPAKFADKAITFTGVAVILPARPLPRDEFLMLFDNLARPRSLTFAYAPGLGKKVNDGKVKPNGLYKVRMTAKVDAAATITGTVTVSKVEILDPTDDSVQRVIE